MVLACAGGNFSFASDVWILQVELEGVHRIASAHVALHCVMAESSGVLLLLQSLRPSHVALMACVAM